MSLMNYSNEIKLSRLKKTFELNFKLTQLYATYLEHCPELINGEMIRELCDDGTISKKEALVALISSAFGLDYDGGEDERRLIRDYLTPSVRLLDAKRYTDNKYYKNINIPNVKDGNWELKTESYEPYRAVICGDMVINSDFSEFAPLGFFTEKFNFPAVLEDGNEWMTLTPVDLDTCEDAIERAHGKVITFGLGLGYYAYMVSLKENVQSITVIEKSDKVIELFRKYILPQFSHAEKVRIINADAFEYAELEMPQEEYNFAFVDTWRDASDGAPMYKRMKALESLSPKTDFSYWIENFLISRLRAEKFSEICDKNLSYEKFTEELLKYGSDI